MKLTIGKSNKERVMTWLTWLLIGFSYGVVAVCVVGLGLQLLKRPLQRIRQRIWVRMGPSMIGYQLGRLQPGGNEAAEMATDRPRYYQEYYQPLSSRQAGWSWAQPEPRQSVRVHSGIIQLERVAPRSSLAILMSQTMPLQELDWQKRPVISPN